MERDPLSNEPKRRPNPLAGIDKGWSSAFSVVPTRRTTPPAITDEARSAQRRRIEERIGHLIPDDDLI
ncbi:hypothetical protein HOG48_03020 [Candidatus Peregrinibacteria bacterium]|nr:hypothetical protein [Candidatus Peregrinibacteria bacterium]